jgi:hypothetical protein
MTQPNDSDLERRQGSEPLERASLVVMNLIKLAGVLVVLNEVFAEPHIREGALAVAALMMAGAQSVETFFSAFFGGGKP